MVGSSLWLALAQSFVCVQLELFDYCVSLIDSEKAFSGSLSVCKSTQAVDTKSGVDL
ncbi:hypothetical protein B0T20DRAFT_357887 [Sordaria brevicollis]|uniref:Uncharacterized protein n=1 Tax=Sordaria brevicollis TaxID=83679 RepID=A0AAE0UA59_SORBR|nr:hypothetical protein B0T20DRAFT_357887 [Sordaria brevicollis]